MDTHHTITTIRAGTADTKHVAGERMRMRMKRRMGREKKGGKVKN